MKRKIRAGSTVQRRARRKVSPRKASSAATCCEKERFVLVDDFSLIHDRAYYAYALALEAVMNLHGQVPSDARPVRPPEPHGQAPLAWDAKS
jgi:hypothetical protein